MNTINLMNLAVKDFVSTYDISDGNIELIFPISTKGNLCVDIAAGSFEYPKSTPVGTDLTGTLDATVDFFQSSDGVNSQQVDGATQLVLSSAQIMGGWQSDNFEAAFGHIFIKQNNVTEGTIRILYTLK
ncbi:MAG: hypothetical protein GY849_02365 [Deltaproteobacteria bacterium]|nr:hypothetical protein [Deltaproteobacteria bacterium]